MKRKLIHRKIIVRGGGVRKYIIEHTNNGIKYLRMQSIDGVKRLVPYAFDEFSKLTDKGINHLVPVIGANAAQVMTEGNASLTHGLSDLVTGKLVAKMGGRVKPTRSLIMREINHALRTRG